MGDDPFDSEVSSPSSSSSSEEHNTLQPSSDDHCKENKHKHVNDDDDDDEDYDDDDDDSYGNDLNTELACPFCFEGFDAVGLFCHVDDVHPIHSKCGICPICGGNLGTNLAGHLSTQHNTILKAFRKKIRQCDGDFHSVVSLLKKELKDVHMLQQQSQGSHPSSSSSSSSKLEADPLLSSFIYSSPLHPSIPPPSSSSEANNTALQSGIQKLRLSANDEEKARRCEFVSSLIFSTILDDDDDI